MTNPQEEARRQAEWLAVKKLRDLITDNPGRDGTLQVGGLDGEQVDMSSNLLKVICAHLENWLIENAVPLIERPQEAK